MEKIYCQNCKFGIRATAVDLCSYQVVTYVMTHWGEREKRIDKSNTPKITNAKNDCPNFKKKWWRL